MTCCRCCRLGSSGASGWCRLDNCTILIPQQGYEVLQLLLQMGGPRSDLASAVALSHRHRRYTVFLEPKTPVSETCVKADLWGRIRSEVETFRSWRCLCGLCTDTWHEHSWYRRVRTALERRLQLMSRAQSRTFWALQTNMVIQG
jgi:hypothetical protein